MGKKKGSRRRRAAKIGIVSTAIVLAGIDEMSNGALRSRALKQIRSAAGKAGLHFTGSQLGDGLVMILGAAFVKKELNKAQLNPPVGPFKAF